MFPWGRETADCRVKGYRAPMAQLVEYRTTLQEVAGSNAGRTGTQGLKLTENKVLPL